MRFSRADFQRFAVVSDGLDFLAKVEREFLKNVIKGPESLESAFVIRASSTRLLDVNRSKDDLRKQHANGVLSYLRRGETENYRVSQDSLKGGIPAQRSQVKGRKPYWYSLQGDRIAETRIIFPEHIDRRYLFTLVPRDNHSVVIDKLYTFLPASEDLALLIHASLNSLLTWYQVELRGRSQMGEGVLELKIPDFSGLSILNPEAVELEKRDRLLRAFAALREPGKGPSLSELGSAERLAFDLAYADACGFQDPAQSVQYVENALRALAGERAERKFSVADAKINRRKLTSSAASIDAYAARIADTMGSFPDPLDLLEPGTSTTNVEVFETFDGHIEVGSQLFDQGNLLVDGVLIAKADTVLAAHFVRGVLLAHPDLSLVPVPNENLHELVSIWQQDCRRWFTRFDGVAAKVLTGLEDPKVQKVIQERALQRLKALRSIEAAV